MPATPIEPDYWERHGSQIYTEPSDQFRTPAILVAELHPLPPSIVQRIIDMHNEALDDAVYIGANPTIK